jgi:chemotaxis signal transduction protein
MDAVLVPVGEDLYAVPIGWVREVVPTPPLTPLVTGPSMVVGLFNLRGEIVPLLDTAKLLGVGRTEHVSFALVLHTALGPAGLSATASPRRALLDDYLGPTELASSDGSYRVGDAVAVLLDVQALLDSLATNAGTLDDGSDTRTAVLARHV